MRGCSILARVAGVLCLTITVATTAATTEAAADRDSRHELIFGVEPTRSERDLTMVWLPLLEHLSVQLGLPIRLATVQDIQSFDACLASGFYDIVYLNPFRYVTAHSRDGYRAIARDDTARVGGLLVVRHDSQIHRLDDLNGRTAAFSTLYSFADSILVRSAIGTAGVRISPVYFQSQAAVYNAVAQGGVAVGGGTPDSFAALDESTRAALRVLYRTQDVAPNAFAVHKALPDNLENGLSDILGSVDSNSPDLVGELGISAIVPAQDADWDSLKALAIDPPGGNTTPCPFPN
ncbi:phosphate/phosphite/phosphonate ABC transporter substrate-binding protein [Rhodospirillaceae bacterium KN72]|uniref:Phosphate/phosphite/phosphonate ABC transporter substrate-binding protein n=1 Tax=Pacificispira spongiicola TaxID=2729598 RepID=A0A7Y0HGF7_9PROT|nr:PhnD/SsuA/transferrin family substrate-binding protein [Pacificispira spongiicola]NMM45623.1 phosphate/phosphite/phosphonate ABC transporter substrate-binding protein [Pacificispira spongiicola]